jgi:hypothetical protein
MGSSEGGDGARQVPLEAEVGSLAVLRVCSHTCLGNTTNPIAIAAIAAATIVAAAAAAGSGAAGGGISPAPPPPAAAAALNAVCAFHYAMLYALLYDVLKSRSML